MRVSGGDLPRGDYSSGAPARPGLAEVLGVWGLCAAIAVAIFTTYSRIPLRELYHVDYSGVTGGLSRLLVFLNWPGALIALAVLMLLMDRRPRPLLAVPAVLLCLLILVPGVVDQGDLDAKAINGLPAVGVALVALLTALAWRDGGLGVPGNPRGDGVRVAVGAVLVIVSLPFVFAELGLYIGDVPVLGSIFHSKEVHEGRAAVHLGEHHGFVGVQVVAVALLLSRQLSRMRLPRLREGLALYLSFLIAYGLANTANDVWGEQVVKRGWASAELPNVVRPSLTWFWLVILGATAALYLGVWRRGRLSYEPTRRIS